MNTPPPPPAHRPAAPAPWNPSNESAPEHHSASTYVAAPLPKGLTPLSDPFAPPAAPPPSAFPAVAPTAAPPPPVAGPTPAVAPPPPARMPAAAPVTATVATAPAPAAEPAQPALIPPVAAAPAPTPAPPAQSPAPSGSIPSGTIAALLNPAPAAEEKAKGAGLESLTESSEVKSMSDAIAASLASNRSDQAAPKAGKMAAITAPASTVEAGGGPAASSQKHAHVPVAPGAPGYRPKPNAKKSEKGGRRGHRRATDDDDKKRRGSAGWYVVTTLILLAASVGVRYAMSEGLPGALGSETLAVGDCVLGDDGGGLGAGEQVTVEKVDCTTTFAQQVVAEVDSEAECPVDADGIVEGGDSTFCVGPPVTDLAFDPGEG